MEEEEIIDETIENIEEIEEIEPPLQEPEATEDDFKGKYFRLLAELENQRKRLQKEKVEANKYAVRGIIRDVLQPFDSMENALKFASQTEGEVKQWAQGFVMILDQFKEILASHGVVPFDSLGTPFDPHKHEAIDTEETEEEKVGLVLEEYQKGYVIDGNTLRPAKVKVGKKQIAEDQQKEGE